MLVASARFISRWRMHAVSACKFSAVGSVQFSSVVRCGCSREPICAPHPVVTLNLSSTASPSMSECSQSVFAVSRSLWFSSDQNAGSQCLLCLARSGSVQVRMLTVSIWCLARSGSVQVRLLTVSIWCLAGFGSVQVRMQAVNFRCVSLALAQFRSAQLQVTLCKVIFTKRSHLTLARSA